jgi:hypothetical protein
MKSAELCFVEIINCIDMNNINNKVINSIGVLSYSKDLELKTNYLRSKKIDNVINYCFNGNIDINDKYTLEFYFSDKTSYISINLSKNCELNLDSEICKIQLLMLKYGELLYKYYNIDEFIFNLINS